MTQNTPCYRYTNKFRVSITALLIIPSEQGEGENNLGILNQVPKSFAHALHSPAAIFIVFR